MLIVPTEHRTHARDVRQFGFSLLEMLVVLLIIGLMTGMVFMSGSLSHGPPARAAAHRLQVIIQLAHDEAQAQGRNLAIGFWQHGWRFYELDPQLIWQPLQVDGPLRSHTLNDEVRLTLRLDGQDVILAPTDQTHPQVFLLSSGEAQPFTLVIEQGDIPREILRGDALGRITQEQAHEF